MRQRQPFFIVRSDAGDEVKFPNVADAVAEVMDRANAIDGECAGTFARAVTLRVIPAERRSGVDLRIARGDRRYSRRDHTVGQCGRGEGREESSGGDYSLHEFHRKIADGSLAREMVRALTRPRDLTRDPTPPSAAVAAFRLQLVADSLKGDRGASHIADGVQMLATAIREKITDGDTIDDIKFLEESRGNIDTWLGQAKFASTKEKQDHATVHLSLAGIDIVHFICAAEANEKLSRPVPVVASDASPGDGVPQARNEDSDHADEIGAAIRSIKCAASILDSVSKPNSAKICRDDGISVLRVIALGGSDEALRPKLCDVLEMLTQMMGQCITENPRRVEYKSVHQNLRNARAAVKKEYVRRGGEGAYTINEEWKS